MPLCRLADPTKELVCRSWPAQKFWMTTSVRWLAVSPEGLIEVILEIQDYHDRSIRMKAGLNTRGLSIIVSWVRTILIVLIPQVVSLAKI
jgi:hypothetical protein